MWASFSEERLEEESSEGREGRGTSVEDERGDGDGDDVDAVVVDDDDDVVVNGVVVGRVKGGGFADDAGVVGVEDEVWGGAIVGVDGVEPVEEDRREAEGEETGEEKEVKREGSVAGRLS